MPSISSIVFCITSSGCGCFSFPYIISASLVNALDGFESLLIIADILLCAVHNLTAIPFCVVFFSLIILDSFKNIFSTYIFLLTLYLRDVYNYSIYENAL